MSRETTEWATWNVGLWIDNDYDLYKAKMRFLRRGNITNESVEAFVKDHFPQGTPDFTSPATYDLVDWHELAEEWREEAETDD